MDFSKHYIEMCRKAEELQALWDPQPGDFYLDSEDDEIYTLCAARHCTFSLGYANTDIWLPRQDQLQRIWMKENEGGKDMWQAFYDFLTKKQSYIEDQLGWYSPEILWLAFVMYEKYQKVWNERTKQWEDI